MHRLPALALIACMVISGLSEMAVSRSLAHGTNVARLIGTLRVEARAALPELAPMPTATPSVIKMSASKKVSSRLRLGGTIVRLSAVQHTITISNTTTLRFYTLELGSSTTLTLGGFPVQLADLRHGDHLIAIGRMDPAHPLNGSLSIVASSVRVSSPSFGGVISSRSAAAHGGTVLTVRANRGHLLRIDATGQTSVVLTAAGLTETGYATDLVVGEHIHASGKRAGALELAATRIHVYPHAHTVGGAIISMSRGQYYIAAQDGSRYLIQTVPATRYMLNGKPSSAAILKLGVHIRARGYNTLQSTKGVTTLITTYISASIHPHTVKLKKPSKSTATPTATPKPKKKP